jgi:hypothetical protein
MRGASHGLLFWRRGVGGLLAAGLGLSLAAWPLPPRRGRASSGPPPEGSAWRVSARADGSLRAAAGGVVLEVRAAASGDAERGDLEWVRGPDGAGGERLGWRLRFGDEEALVLERGPLERVPPPGLAELRVRAATSRGGRTGRLRYELGDGRPPRVALSWRDEGAPAAGAGEVRLDVHVRAPRGLLFVGDQGLVRDGARPGRAAALVTDGGAVGFGPGLFAHYDETGEAHAVTGVPAPVTFDAAAAALASLYGGEGGATVRHGGRVEPPVEGVAVVATVAGRLAGAGFTRADGTFALAAPPGPAALFAAVAGAPAGPAVAAPPPPDAARVPLGPTGRLRVRVRDADTGEPLPARVVVHALAGAREPNFGPHFRAGAGSFVDVEGGEFVTPLPAGAYRLSATRGLAYTIDEARVAVGAGDFVEATLELRRAVETPGWVACDLHVHARPSFDSLVSVEDRLRTLAAAGVDFAVPSEHNHVGDYGAARELGLAGRFAWVPGVEVTTTGPSVGHFNVYPWYDRTPPPHRHVHAHDVVRHVRERHPESLLQINHPRLTKFIGYFDVIGLDPGGPGSRAPIARGFDAIEVYNGFDLNAPARVEAVLRDWLHLFEAGLPLWATASSDSHTVQYTAAGYPRTYVRVDGPGAGGEGDGAAASGGEGGPPETGRVIEGLRRGRAVLTSGPFVDVSSDGRGPGERVAVRDGRARVRVRVLAAPWVDATGLDVLVGGKSVLRRDLPLRPTRTGPPGPSAEAERLEAVRFDEELEVPVAPDARTLVVVVRGERGVGDVLPYMNHQPLAITNPLVLERAD